MSKKERKNKIWRKTNGVCAHCGKEVGDKKKTVDHFIPKMYGGTYDQRNLVPLCKNCNLDKGCEMVNPKEFYSYAPKTVIRQCIRYRNIWLERTSSMYLSEAA